MKKSLITILMLSAAIGLNAQSQKETIEISSKLTAKGKAVNQYTVSLYSDGVELEKYEAKRSHPVFIQLDTGKLYSVHYHKEGYPDKIVIVDTTIPSDAPKDLNFEFDIELDPEYSTIKPAFNDFPVALIRYRKNAEELSYSDSYFSEVHFRQSSNKNQ